MRLFTFVLLSCVAAASVAEQVAPPPPPAVPSAEVNTTPAPVTTPPVAKPAKAPETTPLVTLSVLPSAKEGESATLFFFSTVAQGVWQGGYCLGTDCKTADGMISLRTVAADNNQFFYCKSVRQEKLTVGTAITFDYTVDGNSTIYRRTFELAKNGDALAFNLKTEKVLAAGGPIQVAQVPANQLNRQPAQGQATQASSTGNYALDVINRYRAAHGVHALLPDGGLNVASNASHSVMVGRYQCWAGHGDIESAVRAWLYDDAAWGWRHRQYLLAPDATYGGVGGGPGSWTYNAR